MLNSSFECLLQGLIPGISLNTFLLTAPATVSIQVVNNNGVLVRQLVTTKAYPAGQHVIYWNGRDDQNNAVTAGNYKVRIRKSNLTAVWEGIIGNTSLPQTGSTVHRNCSQLADITISGSKAVYVTDYSEALPSVFAFDTSNPQHKLNVFPPGKSTPDTVRLTNDGVNVYYAGSDPGWGHSFVYATSLANNAKLPLPGGSDYTLITLTEVFNVIGFSDQGSIQGIAAQAGNDFVFFTRPGLNTLYAFNKNTGAITENTSFTNPKEVVFDRAGHLWISYAANNIERYTVNADGTLTADSLQITGVIDPGKIDVSYDGSTVGVIDYDTQQLKLYNTEDGSFRDVIGQAGGYTASSTAAHDKFCLKTIKTGNLPCGFCYAPDGSLWIVDTGSNRMQHFTGEGAFIETLATNGNVYTTNVDASNPTRVTNQFLEYAVDYSKPLSDNTGWSFSRNWRATVPANYDVHQTLRFIKTFPNGKTYTMLRCDQGQEMVELVTDGIPRFSGQFFEINTFVDENNNLIHYNTRYALTGYDSNNFPVFSNTAEVFGDFTNIQGGTASDDDKDLFSGIGEMHRSCFTADNKLIIFQPSLYRNGDHDNGYMACNHLGAVAKDGNSWLWQTQTPTFEKYTGPFPPPDKFDIGNGVIYPGGIAHVLGNIIMTGYHGENWEQGQTNKYNIYYSDGQPLLQFGTTQHVYEIADEAKAEMAGNALTPQLVAGANSDEMYLYHGDESFHGGVHRWKIAGFDSISELPEINITIPSAVLLPPALPGIDLMAGLPFNTALASTTYSRWTFNVNDPGFLGRISQLSYLKDDIDIYIKSTVADSGPDGFFYCSCYLGGNNLSSWKITGQMIYQGQSAQGGQQKQYLDVLDGAGKVIARLTDQFAYNNGGGDSSTVVVYANGQVLHSGTLNQINGLLYNYQDLEISAEGTDVTIKLGVYSVTTTVFETGANPNNPAVLRPGFQGGYNPVGVSVDLKGLRFLAVGGIPPP